MLVHADLVTTYKKDLRFLKKTSWEHYLKNQKGCDIVTYKKNNFVMRARALDKMQLALASAKANVHNKRVNNKTTYEQKLFRLQAEICGSQQAWKDKYETLKVTTKQKHLRARQWTAWWTKVLLKVVLYQNRTLLLYKTKRAQKLARFTFDQKATLTKQQQVKRWFYKSWFYPLPVDNFDLPSILKHFASQAEQKEIKWQKWMQTRQGVVVQRQEQRLVKKMVRWANRFLHDNTLFHDQKVALVKKYLTASKEYRVALKAQYQTTQRKLCTKLATDLTKWRALFHVQKKVLKISDQYGKIAMQRQAKKGAKNVR